jgi:hypothetical protein
LFRELNVTNGELNKDALRNFSDVNANLCRFYHESETKVGSLINFASLLGVALAGSTTANETLAKFVGLPVMGLAIVALGVIGFVSILAYWRYYEACWMHVDVCQKRLLGEALYSEVHSEVKTEFRSQFPFLKRVSLDAHHWIWLASMGFWICIGGVIIARWMGVSCTIR